MAAEGGLAPLDRTNLLPRTLAILSRGGWVKADVLLVRDGESLVIVKDFGTRRGFLRDQGRALAGSPGASCLPVPVGSSLCPQTNPFPGSVGLCS